MSLAERIMIGSAVIFCMFLVAFAFVPLPATLFAFIGIEAAFLMSGVYAKK